MKHIHKYIFATIIILLLTSTVQSSPKAFDSLGNELEALQKDCKEYLKDPKVSKKIKATCKKFNIKVNKAFKVGYPLDASVENDTANEKKVARYLALLRNADEGGKSLVRLIESETIRARKNNNIKYFSFLINYNKKVLSSKNYEFMKQHHEEFQDHPIYKQIIKEEKRKAEEKKAKEEAAQKKQRDSLVKLEKIKAEKIRRNRVSTYRTRKTNTDITFKYIKVYGYELEGESVQMKATFSNISNTWVGILVDSSYLGFVIWDTNGEYLHKVFVKKRKFAERVMQLKKGDKILLIGKIHKTGQFHSFFVSEILRR